MHRDACAMSVGVLDVPVGVCRRGRVRLGGHNPRERGEGRMDVGVKIEELVLVLFAHV